MNAIFLDFDGTMIPTAFSKFMEQMNNLSKDKLSNDAYGEFFAPYCVENLLSLMKEKDAKIVFTTNWRDKGHDFLVEMFTERYNIPSDYILGSAKVLSNQKRGDEIKDFIDSNSEIKNYVILDDMGKKFFLEDQYSRLIECDPMFGFTTKELNIALELL